MLYFFEVVLQIKASSDFNKLLICEKYTYEFIKDSDIIKDQYIKIALDLVIASVVCHLKPNSCVSKEPGYPVLSRYGQCSFRNSSYNMANYN